MRNAEAKRQREIARLEAKLARPRRKNELLFLLLQITIIYCSNEIAVQIGDQMQSVIANDIFAPVFGADVALARLSAFAVLTGLGSTVGSFVRPFSDRFGRKAFLILNTVGLGASLIVIGVATGIPVYVLGAFVLSFFTPHDLQTIYIFEISPTEKRATYYSICRAGATIGMLLIPLMRAVFMREDASGWRIIYYIFGASSLILAVICMFTLQESDVWMESRLKLLKMTPEERALHEKKHDGTSKTIGLIGGIKTCLSNRQTRWLVIAAGFINFGLCFTTYYESTMTYGYSGQLLVAGGNVADLSAYVLEMVTNALFFFPVGSALAQLFPGVLGDHLGRKKASLIMGVVTVGSYALFYLGALWQWGGYLLGFLSGMCVGAYWSCIDFAGNIMISESVPTNQRGAVLVAVPIIYTAIGTIGRLMELVLVNLLGDAFAGFVCLCVGIPGMTIGLILLGRYAVETKGRDLSEVTLANNEEAAPEEEL